MIEFQQALSMAKTHYARTNEVVTKAWSHPDFWIFYGDAGNGLTKIGGHSLCVAKEDGKISTLHLPSKNGFALFAASVPVQF